MIFNMPAASRLQTAKAFFADLLKNKNSAKGKPLEDFLNAKGPFAFLVNPPVIIEDRTADAYKIFYPQSNERRSRTFRSLGLGGHRNYYPNFDDTDTPGWTQGSLISRQIFQVAA